MATTKRPAGGSRTKATKATKGGKGAKGTKGTKGKALRRGPDRKGGRGGGAAKARGGRSAGPRRERQAPKTAVRPRRAPPASPPVAAGPDTARPTAVAIAQAGLDKKAEDVTVLDVRGLAGYADYFVVMTADSDRQSAAIADNVEERMKALGVSKVSVEGYETGRWVLLDYGDVLAHVMNRESREFYDLEGLWADAPRFHVEA
jgi:ribosome-associated protein